MSKRFGRNQRRKLRLELINLNEEKTKQQAELEKAKSELRVRIFSYDEARKTAFNEFLAHQNVYGMFLQEMAHKLADASSKEVLKIATDIAHRIPEPRGHVREAAAESGMQVIVLDLKPLRLSYAVNPHLFNKG